MGADRGGIEGMRVLLDVCTPVQVRQALPDHDVRTAVKMGWGRFEVPSVLDHEVAVFG